MSTPMEGKRVVVTGANSGIGKVTAIRLAELGASLVLVCRSPEKASRVREEVSSKTGRSDVQTVCGDLLIQSEVRKVANEISTTNNSLNVLVNNAGTNFPSYGETSDGIERTMAVNYFAPFLLTNLLLQGLERGAPSRVVNVSSVAHFRGDLDLDNLTKDRRMGAGGLAAYGRSKLALVLFTYELARRVKGKGVTANCLHPGAVRTNIWSHSGAAAPIVRLASLFMASPNKGSETPVYLASSKELEGVSGRYFEGMKEKESSAASYDQTIAARLWDLSEGVTGLK
jgi:retinol dehydrogenase 14